MIWVRSLIAKYEIYICLGLCLFFFSSGWYVHGKFYAAKEKAVLQALIKDHMEKERQANKRSVSLEEELKDLRIQQAKDQVELNSEIKKPEYTRCVVPERSLQLINSAIRPRVSSQHDRNL